MSDLLTELVARGKLFPKEEAMCQTSVSASCPVLALQASAERGAVHPLPCAAMRASLHAQESMAHRPFGDSCIQDSALASGEPSHLVPWYATLAWCTGESCSISPCAARQPWGHARVAEAEPRFEPFSEMFPCRHHASQLTCWC